MYLFIYFSFCMHQFGHSSIFEYCSSSYPHTQLTLLWLFVRTAKKWTAAEYILDMWIMHEDGLIYVIKCKWCVHFPGCLSVQQFKWRAPRLVHIVGAWGMAVIQEAHYRIMNLQHSEISHNLCHISFPFSFLPSLSSAYFQSLVSTFEILLHIN